jgi:hypothetical protein
MIMTKKIAAVLVLTVLLSNAAFAQKAKRNAVFVDVGPLIEGLIFGGFGLGVGYERALTDYWTVLGHGDYESILGGDLWALDIDVHGRYYFQLGPAVAGLFADLGLGYGLLSWKGLFRDETVTASAFTISAKVGYKYIFRPGFFLEPAVGYSFAISGGLKDSTGEKHTGDIGGTGLNYGMSLGWAF